MMGIVVPETCSASNKFCNKNHLLHLVGILLYFHVLTTMYGQNHIKLPFCLCNIAISKCNPCLSCKGYDVYIVLCMYVRIYSVRRKEE